MTSEQIRQTVLSVLGSIAPEADLQSLDPHVSLRDQLDIDSVDFLNFVIGIHKELGIDIPEADAPKLATIDSCVTYLRSKSEAQGGKK
ncbi:MAG: acyl carrier protein [Deltaproteobacteria bacterium]|nr:acyl carrier protein [Deltaproteobacteria bacterium]